ncbi:Protein of unknown function [Actinoplanes regularis]|uniref:Uncharacterized protein n=2 Tax=Actinoplanes regularis TaxID=52697 RepID=A0A239CK35_9ACTN|nr:hypothetical protein Are01nite_58470 [Actinoplanes regularis]SNS19834.1 Protein of unknown function [Actinoplanes regularis]
MSDLSPATRADDPLAGLTVVTGSKPRVEPLDPPMVPFALAGLAAFAVATLVFLLTDAPREWLETSVAGFLVGIPGLITMIVHDQNRRQRRALSHPEFRIQEV